MAAYCRHSDARCLVRGVPCTECDSEGYPTHARRRLKRVAADLVEDVDDRRRFRVTPTKGGDRLMPVFARRVSWETAAGFAAMQLILSCLGAVGEYVLWDDVAGAAMTEDSWKRRRPDNRHKPSVWHRACNETVTTADIHGLRKGYRPGCTCVSLRARHWRRRRAEVVAWGERDGYEVLTSSDEWVERCDGIEWRPMLRCNECQYVVTTSSLHHLQRGNKPGCRCCSNHANAWPHRRAEVVSWGEERGFEVVTTSAEWLEQCTGVSWRPTLRCLRCRATVTSTHIYSLQQGQNIGCECHSSHARHWKFRRSEIVALGHERGFDVVTTDDEWLERCSGSLWCPTLRCTKCHETVTSTMITSIHYSNQRAGCTCNSNFGARLWARRRAEVVEWGEQRGFEVLTTDEEWAAQCGGSQWCPTLRCIVCKDTVTSTAVGSLGMGRNIGCICHWARANHYRHRRDEVAAWGKQRGSFEVLTTSAEWAEQCDGNTWCPTLRCLKCGDIVTSTSCGNLQCGNGIGCRGCTKKTERKLHEWLVQRFPTATVQREYRGPCFKGWCHFDFHLTFPDGFGVLVELDGDQHFWPHLTYFTDEGCARDLAKERWAIGRGLCVVRVLQGDVWLDRLDWRGFVARSIEGARQGPARILAPDAPEYTSTESAYARLRTQ